MKTLPVLCAVAVLAASASVASAAPALPWAGFEAQSFQAAKVFSAAQAPVHFQLHSPWQELTGKVLALGTFREADEVLPATYGLEDVRGAKDAAHVANYVNVWGFKDSSGRFQPSFMTFVSENWNVDAQGRWVISQWLFTLGLDGTIADVSRHTIVETRDNDVVDYQSQAKKPQDDDVIQERDSLLTLWTAFGRR